MKWVCLNKIITFKVKKIKLFWLYKVTFTRILLKEQQRPPSSKVKVEESQQKQSRLTTTKGGIVKTKNKNFFFSLQDIHGI